MDLSSKYNLIRKVSEDLNLVFETQDWGIINSSSQRLEEFLDYFNSNLYIDNVVKYEVFELIVASFNDYLVDVGFCCENDNNFKKFIYFFKENYKEELYKTIIDYWQLNDFPISELIYKVMGQNS